MSSKMMLKKQGSLLGEVFSDDSDCENAPENINMAVGSSGRASNSNNASGGNSKQGRERSASNTNKSGKRRSSFGGARFKNEEEQTRIVDMYTNIIKLSSENKINEKNSWGLDLIEHMGKLIKADSSKQRGVNFQKASCTLDASVKIYANRVDDTYSHSHRVLESFSRNDNSKASHDSDDENGADPSKPRRAARVGASKASNRLNIGDTIEKDVDNINAKEVENEVQLDPMFHTISKLFDKGGTEGMLMQNLRCNPYSSAMALSQDGLPDPYTGEVDADAFEAKDSDAVDAAPVVLVAPVPLAEEEAAPSSSSCKPEMLDLTDIIAAVNVSLPDLQSMTICPQLSVYRAQIHNKGKEAEGAAVDAVPTSGTTRVGVLEPRDFAGSHHLPTAPSDDAFTLMSSVHSLTRDITTIPFADMSEAAKSCTYANPRHAYFDAMVALCAPANEGAAAEETPADLFESGENDYDYTDTAAGAGDDGAGAGFDEDDCDDEGNYVSSNRRASCLDINGTADEDETTAAASGGGGGNTRQSMLQPADVNGGDDGNVAQSLGKLRWDAVNGDADITEEQLLSAPDQAALEGVGEIIANGANEENEYSFFDMAALGSQSAKSASNDWAGAKHWKRAPSSRAAALSAAQKATQATLAETEEAEEEEEEKPKKGKAKAKKASVELDLSDALIFPSESLFKAPTGRGGSNTTLLTAAALNKQVEAADDGELFLPVDSKLEPKDLCRLFIADHVVVPPAVFAHLIKTKAGQGDSIWGQRGTSAAAGGEGRFVNGPSLDSIDEVYDNDENCDYDDDAFFVQQQEGQSAESEAAASDTAVTTDENATMEAEEETAADAVDEAVKALTGLEIDESKLVQVGRKVDKIDIGYSKIAKKINVKVLKTDMWREISDLSGGTESAGAAGAGGVDGNGSENAPPAADFHATETGESQITDNSSYCDGREMSFQGLVNDLAVRQKQKDVSVSFYFICLLHLANEKTLKLEDNGDLNDLIVTKD